MTVEEIFSKLVAHLREGLMFHKQLVQIYSFLNLCGYQKCQEYHYYEESYNCLCLRNFYMKHYYKLIPPQDVKNPELIPSSWYKYKKMDVDINTKRSSIKETLQKWVNWEESTKKLLEEDYIELYNMKEIAAALKIAELINDVSEELQRAQEKLINLSSSNFDMTLILEEQNDLYEKYKKKIKNIYKDDNDD